MELGIVGAGAVGLTLGAGLARVHRVVFLARRPEVAAVLERDGVAVEGAEGTRYAVVSASTDPRALGGCDAVIVAVKSYSTAGSLRPLRGVLPVRALIASVQNGIGNAAAARAALPGARVVAGSTMQGAIRLGDGRVRPINRAATIFGRSDDDGTTSADLAGAFAAAGLEARVDDDIELVLWRKLVVNAAINPACALAGATNGEAVTDPELVPLVRALAAEAGLVARAEGIELGDVWAAVEAAGRASAANRNSMLQDLDAGRPTEIDAISGEIARRARRHGIAVPQTDAILERVLARERRA